MASSVESQRLISLSLGKIAQSRSQKGGINLHKNLLVATVLHKARTACMLEYHTLQRQRQLEMQQRQQQQQLEFEQQQEQARAAALSLAAFNTSQTTSSQSPEAAAAAPVPIDTIPTCVREMEAEEEMCVAASSDLDQVATVPEVGHDQSEASASGQDKENSPPDFGDVSCVEFTECEPVNENVESTVQVVPESTASGPLHHLAAATQLAHDAAAGAPTTAAPTCNVLKRQRDNSSQLDIQMCPPVNKKARLVASRRESTKDTCSVRLVTSSPEVSPNCNGCEASQISNLVSIFNSGFTGLCAVSAAAGVESSHNYSSATHLSGGESVACQSDLSCYTRDSSSLSCSSSLGRLDSLPSAINLVLSV